MAITVPIAVWGAVVLVLAVGTRRLQPHGHAGNAGLVRALDAVAVAVVEDRLAGIVVNLSDILGEMFQLMRLQAFEQRHSSQALRFFA